MSKAVIRTHNYNHRTIASCSDKVEEANKSEIVATKRTGTVQTAYSYQVTRERAHDSTVDDSARQWAVNGLRIDIP